MYKQVIILRENYDNGHTISFGKACGQCCHASMAFLTNIIKKHIVGEVVKGAGKGNYRTECIDIDKDLYEQWINGIFTKCILKAKNKNQLLKAKTMAEEMGMKENEDFFIIADCCNTELEPEFIDENGVGRTLTAIGFRPMDSEVIDKIGKKYQLYK